MSFFELIEKRRSIRKYEQRAVEPEKAAKIMEAALRAPSSRDRQPWEFVVATNAEIIKRLAQAKERSISFLAEAPMAVVVCADAEKSDIWIEDASIASTFIILAAEALGLGSCWIQIRGRKQSGGKSAEQFIRETLNIPTRLKILAIIALGYAGEEKLGHSAEGLPRRKVFLNYHGNKFQ